MTKPVGQAGRPRQNRLLWKGSCRQCWCRLWSRERIRREWMRWPRAIPQ